MSSTNKFIERPVLAICISIAIVFLGLLALKSLSIEKFPDIAPPTVHVSASQRSVFFRKILQETHRENSGHIPQGIDLQYRPCIRNIGNRNKVRSCQRIQLSIRFTERDSRT